MDRVFDEQVKGIAALENQISRSAYRLVIEHGWINRDTAAEILAIARSVATFHLEKLVDAGLLKVRYERTSGRTGPGAGRPTKFYGRSMREFELSLPPRRYDLAGSLLADAVARTESDGTPIAEAVSQAAREAGESAGAELASLRAESAYGVALLEVLERNGYEPKRDGNEITLLNCPFDTLAEQQRDLVCGMNLDFLIGVVNGVGDAESITPRLAPEPGYCCVRLAVS